LLTNLGEQLPAKIADYGIFSGLRNNDSLSYDTNMFERVCGQNTSYTSSGFIVTRIYRQWWEEWDNVLL